MFRLDLSGNKPVLLFFYTLLLSLEPRAQMNLVPNGGFENYSSCPEIDGGTDGEINKATPWYDPYGGTSDLLHVCNNTIVGAANGHSGVPSNYWGYQWPHSGNGYAGLGGFQAGSSQIPVEHIAVQLIEPLQNGKCYTLKLYVNRSEKSCISHNLLGAFFTSDSTEFDYSTQNQPQFIFPQLSFDQVINDTIGWIELEGSFVANGGETYMCIGVFNSININVNDELPCWAGFYNTSYIYIDDISLAESQVECETMEIPNIFTPNGDGVNDFWKFESNLELDVCILNRWGNIVYRQTANVINWDGKDVNGGVYFYIVKTKQHTKTGFIQLIK